MDDTPQPIRDDEHTDSLLARRLQWERENPRDAALVKAEEMVVRGLRAYGFGDQHQITTERGFEIAVDDLVINVRLES